MRRGWAGEAMHGSNSSSLGMERVLVFSLGPLKREIRMAVTPATMKVQVLGLCLFPPPDLGAAMWSSSWLPGAWAAGAWLRVVGWFGQVQKHMRRGS